MVEDVPAKPTDGDDAETKKAYKEWHTSNRKPKSFIRTTMIDSVRGSIKELETAWDHLEPISQYYMENDQAEISRLSRQFYDMTFSGVDSVREHIIGMMDINARLRDLNMRVKDHQVVAQMLDSLPATFSNLKTFYNASEANCSLNKLMSMRKRGLRKSPSQPLPLT
ncbi:uncharacterized protein LOC126803627 [Argentina anserina]|uniref:uncharacterized protein LOC126803627 n=1 Tax=Argentina anserina TaxID=57926 RepID=UPI0021768ADA|nr:uncharacterized protein LOC126803627 [Potentilla anserina]